VADHLAALEDGMTAVVRLGGEPEARVTSGAREGGGGEERGFSTVEGGGGNEPGGLLEALALAEDVLPSCTELLS
jgi:hypothetical protein